VGGPSTARAEWVSDLAAYCAQNNAPIDFFSTHVYPGDPQETLFGKGANVPRGEVIPTAVNRARQQIEASRFAGRPLWLSEWSSDSPAFIAHTITGSLPYCQAMSHWVLSGTYEELGVADFVLRDGDMGFSLLARGGIPKPAYNTYRLLHALGDQRLAADGPALASRHGGLTVALVWNLAEVSQPSGIPGQRRERTVTGGPKRYEVEFKGARAGQRVRVSFVDQERGSPVSAWRQMGSPQYPTARQIETLRHLAEIPTPKIARLDRSGRVALILPPEGVALIELI
jgi:xylan 1,4-beta-xylosidase